MGNGALSVGSGNMYCLNIPVGTFEIAIQQVCIFQAGSVSKLTGALVQGKLFEKVIERFLIVHLL